MDITKIKTGDIFEYDNFLLDKIHHHRCRVLFIGEEHLFYDAWWKGLNEWTFIPVKKDLCYYRIPLEQISKLTFNGFSEINRTDAQKLFLHSPEILLRTTKDEISSKFIDNTLLNTNSSTIAFVPIEPKGGWLKAAFLETFNLTRKVLVEKIQEYQNLDFITTNQIIVDRIGLHKGVPSYSIRRQ
jgi:hypothetical protein